MCLHKSLHLFWQHVTVIIQDQIIFTAITIEPFLNFITTNRELSSLRINRRQTDSAPVIMPIAFPSELTKMVGHPLLVLDGAPSGRQDIFHITGITAEPIEHTDSFSIQSVHEPEVLWISD